MFFGMLQLPARTLSPQEYQIGVRTATEMGYGAICKRWGSQFDVIPAKAGIHFANLQKCGVHVLGSRFRGNDLLHIWDAIRSFGRHHARRPLRAPLRT